MTSPIITERLILRPWKDEDFAPFAEMNADPQVREFFPSLLTREESDAGIRSLQGTYARDGFCFFPAELIATGEFIGFIGIQTMDFAVPSVAQPAVEIGWRLARSAWGQGYATEAGQAALEYGFDTIGLPEVVAVTMASNARSQAVMRRIGMTTDPAEDFDDPDVDEAPLRHHVVYRKLRQVA